MFKSFTTSTSMILIFEDSCLPSITNSRSLQTTVCGMENAMLIRALKYPHTFEYVVLQQLAVILASRFTTKAVASLPISPSIELTNGVKFLRWSKQA
eukprot:scaffold38884_cov66-Attheya_sp.AAC.3